MSKIKSLSVGFLSHVSLGNVNASHTEGNVIITKKFTLPDGTMVPYISGQALRRMLRDRLYELGWELSEPHMVRNKQNTQEVIPPTEPWKYIDEDLFGYMDTKGIKRRTSPVRVSPLIGLFPYQGDRDLGTRSFERFGTTMEAGGNMFETELYTNLFKGVMLVELDRIGRYDKIREMGIGKDKKKKEFSLPPDLVEDGDYYVLSSFEQRVNRIKALLEAMKILWGGGRTARMLVDLSPKFIAFAFMKVKHPIFLDSMKVDYENGFELKIERITQVLAKYQAYIEKTIFGIETSFFVNEEQVKEELGEVYPIHEAIDKAKEEIERFEW